MGRFVLDGVSPGEWAVDVAAEGFVRARREVTVKPGETSSVGAVSLRLKRVSNAAQRTVIEGTAKRQGINVEDGHGAIRVESVGTPFATVTTSRGLFRLEVTPGAHSVRVSYPGYGSVDVEVADVPQGETYRLPDEVVLIAQPGRVRVRSR